MSTVTNSKEYIYYDRDHDYDEGARLAMSRGELPLTYWSKKAILENVYFELDKAEEQLKPLIARYKYDMFKVKQTIKKFNHEFLKANALIRTGQHRTGNYYRNTMYYRNIKVDELEKFLVSHVLKHEVWEQTKLPLYK